MEDSGDDEGMMGIVVPCADAAAALQKIAAAAASRATTSRTMLGGRKTPKPFFFSTSEKRGRGVGERVLIAIAIFTTGLILNLERGRSCWPP